MRAAGKPEGYGPLGATGLLCSRVGFGGYRVDDETPEHREALRKALASGSNLIDTSTNYTDGGSERLVGEVLAELAGSGRVPREEVVVVSKMGYVQGQNLERAIERETSGRPFPEMVKYGEGVWHCLHPEFLEDQLTRSLERLGLQSLDVCLLHNPEYYLSDAHERSHGTLAKRREEFYRRLGDAFVFLEGAAAAGRIRWYGVSSNTCTRPADDPEATSLTTMLEAARRAGGDGHRFRVLQLPMNLLETGAALERNNGPDLDQTVLEFAAAHDIGVLVNRPLNAMSGEGMVRLAEVPPAEGKETPLDDQLAILAALEAEYRREIAARLQVPEGATPPDQFFRWSADLRGAAAHVRSLEHWAQIESHRIVPRLTQAVQALDRGLTGPMAEQWREWRGRYLPELRTLLDAMRARAAAQSRAVSQAVSDILDPMLPAERRGETLSRKASWVLASTPGVSSVLVGMRTPAYVSDALGILAWPPLDNAKRVHEAMRDVVLPA
jgi:aryl-alcohol dehydrogenase-like predicted oxidoreductase